MRPLTLLLCALALAVGPHRARDASPAPPDALASGRRGRHRDDARPAGRPPATVRRSSSGHADRRPRRRGADDVRAAAWTTTSAADTTTRSTTMDVVVGAHADRPLDRAAAGLQRRGLDAGAAADPARARGRPDRGRPRAGGVGVPAASPRRPAPTDARRLFDQFLSRDIPDEGEASFTFVGERAVPLQRRPRHEPGAGRPRARAGRGRRRRARRHRGHPLHRGADHRRGAAQGHVRRHRRPRARARRGRRRRAGRARDLARHAGGRVRARLRRRRPRARAAADARRHRPLDRVHRRPHAPDRRHRGRRDRRARPPVQRDARPARAGLRAAARVRLRRRPRAAHADHDHPRPPAAARRRRPRDAPRSSPTSWTA